MKPTRKQEFTVRPWPELREDPIYLPDDPVQEPFLTSVNLNLNKDPYDNDSNIQLVKTSSDGRNKQYKYNGSAAEAITAALQAEGRV